MIGFSPSQHSKMMKGKNINMDYQRHDTRKAKKSLDTRSSPSTDASPSPSSSHPARQRELRLRGITEEEFVQGSKSRRVSESPGYNRETGESRLWQLWDALFGTRK